MNDMKKPPTAGNEGAQGTTLHSSEPSAASGDGQGLAELYEIAERCIFVPYKLVPKGNGKTDKVPCDGQRNLSCTEPTHLMPLVAALALVNEWRDLHGVGLVFEGGIVHDGWQLIGLDYDGVDFGRFELPVASYAERSPSGNGIHQLAWVPAEWAARFRYTTGIQLAGCHHGEVYLASRFLTVTGDRIDDEPIAKLTPTELAVLEDWGLKPYEAPVDSAATPAIPDGGQAFAWSQYNLTPDQRHLIDGTGQIDRSKVFQGLLIKVLEKESLENALASTLKTPALLQYCQDHRSGGPERAIQFAKEEIARAYKRTNRYLKDRLVSYDPAWKPAEPEPEPSKAIPFPPPFRGPMTDLVADALKAAIKPQPELTTLAALIGMATALGAYWKLPGGGRLNLYGCGIAATGDGKDLPRCLAALIAKHAFARTIGKPGSGQGLEDRLVAYTGMLCEVDEIAHFFEAVNNSRAPGYLIELAANLLRLFSASRTAYNTRPLRGKDEPKTIEHPALSVIGFATPEKLGRAVTVDNVADGLLGRFLFVPGQEDPLELSEWEHTFSDLVLRDSIKTKLRDIHKVWMTGWLNDDATLIGATPEAKQAFKDLMREFRQRGRSTPSPQAKALLKRSNEKATRIAGVLAAWDSPVVPVITLEHVEWAAQFVRASDAAVLAFMDEYVHGGCEQDNAAKVTKLMRRLLSGELGTADDKAGALIEQGVIPRSLLLRRSKMDKKSFDAAVAYLVDSDSIEQGAVTGKHANGRDETTCVLRLLKGE